MQKQLCSIWRESLAHFPCCSSSLWPEGHVIFGNRTYILFLYYVFLLMISNKDWICQLFISILNPWRALKVPICLGHGLNTLGIGVRVGWHDGGGFFEGWDLRGPQGTSGWSWRISLVAACPCHPQVAARTGETGVRRRTQAMSRSASKRRSRFSSLWGLDTTSKKKQGRPSINQVGSRADEKRARTNHFCGHLNLGCVCFFSEAECYLKSTSWHKETSCARHF